MKRVLSRQQIGLWLRQGSSPRRLALTLALGCAIGCIPMVGIPTLLCAVLALSLGLNQPAIQAANYAVMPAQVFLIIPFVRFGGWLVAYGLHRPAQSATVLSQFSPLHLASGIGMIAAQAMLAWLVVATPAVLLLTPVLTHLLRRVPALAATETARDQLFSATN